MEENKTTANGAGTEPEENKTADTSTGENQAKGNDGTTDALDKKGAEKGGSDKADTSKNGADKGNAGKTEPKFTQEEVNEIISKRSKRAAAKALSDAGISEGDLADFKSWKETQRTAEEKHNEAVRQLTIRAETAEAEITRFKTAEAVRGSGVDEKFIKFVTHEVMGLAKDKDLDFEDALAVFMKTDGEAYKKQDAPQKSTNTSVPIEPPKTGGNEAALAAIKIRGGNK